MIHFDELQVDSRDFSDYHGAKAYLGSFGKGRIVASRIARRKNEGKDKMNSDKGTDPKYLSVNSQIMNAYRKIKRKDSKR